jgi:RecG-like helicase
MKMKKTKFRVNVTFFQHLAFHKEDKEKESKRIHKGLTKQYKHFKKIIETNITKKEFGPLKGIGVSIGDDDDIYPDSTQVEYWFGFDYTCAASEEEIVEDYDGKGVLELSENAQQRIKEKIERVLYNDYYPDLTITAQEMHSFKSPNVVIHKPIDYTDS